LSVFEPTRLTAAREVRGLRMNALADKASVSPGLITQYEQGVTRPELDTLHRLSSVLAFPTGFFLLPELKDFDSDTLNFRARRAMTSVIRHKAKAAGNLATGSLSGAIRARFKLPPLSLPDLTGQAPETAAESLRLEWALGQGPISNMVHLLESRGIEVYWVSEDAACLDGFSVWRNEQPYVLLNAAKPAGDRGRYDAAHELGHLVLHRTPDSLRELAELEDEANRFAASFLLPAHQFAAESPRSPNLLLFAALKDRWQVSIAAMVRRSRDLGLLSQWQYQSAFKEISRRGWRIDEPAPVMREDSLLHEKIFSILIDKGVTARVFAEATAIPDDLLLDLMPVARAYLKPYEFNEAAYSLEDLLGMSSS
jgi:Zn-dependent peptidase ImmA (M78 family)